MTKWHGGKGSNPRKVDKDKFDENFDRIFGKKDKDSGQAETGRDDPDAEVCETKTVRE